MKSFQKVDNTNKNAVTLAGVHTHTHNYVYQIIYKNRESGRLFNMEINS